MFDSLNIFVGRNVKQFKTTALAKFKKKNCDFIWYCRDKTKNSGIRIHFQNHIVFLKNM